jgi:hypothetical protein
MEAGKIPEGYASQKDHDESEGLTEAKVAKAEQINPREEK